MTPTERIRREKGISAKKLAEDAGITRQTLCRIEAGKNATLETMQLVAKALGVPLRELF